MGANPHRLEDLVENLQKGVFNSIFMSHFHPDLGLSHVKPKVKVGLFITVT